MNPSHLLSSQRRVRSALALLALTASVGALPVAVPAHAAAPRASLSSLALSGSDVQHAFGSGFKTYNYTTTGSAGTTSGYTFRQIGLAAWYERAFIKNIASLVNGTAASGTYSVGSVIYRFKSTSYADAAVRYALKHKIWSQKGYKYQVTRTGGVGSIAVTITSTETFNAYKIHVLGIGFERGAYVAAVFVFGFGATASVSTTTSLARLVDARIKAHG
ncbi:MAG TPA: hypothetical protein VKX16_14345 [Chloroflexota bacterium]|nr:hypothetical protein [Chloroflexota bacterium]